MSPVEHRSVTEVKFCDRFFGIFHFLFIQLHDNFFRVEEVGTWDELGNGILYWQVKNFQTDSCKQVVFFLVESKNHLSTSVWYNLEARQISVSCWDSLTRVCFCCQVLSVRSYCFQNKRQFYRKSLKC